MENRKTIHVWLYSVLIAALIASLLWGLNVRKTASALEMSVENGYNRAFHELADYIENIDIQLTKAQLATSPSQLAAIANDIFSEAAEAKSCLGQLPTTRVSLENTSKFLSQVGDYTYVLSQSMIKGEQITEDEHKTLAELNNFSTSLKNKLREIQDRIYSGEIKISDLNMVNDNKNTAHADGNGILESLENVEKAFDEYPSLIYDGPFSEHIVKQNPKMLENAHEISKEEALNKAKEFLGDRGRGLKFESESQNTDIPAYTFTTSTQSEQITISVTKKGGYILYFLDNVLVENTVLDVASATEKAMKFLESRGIYDMVSSYYEKSDNVATINFAYSQNGVTCYSDLVKVRVALDSGEIVGFESKGYLMNHAERSFTEPSFSIEEAKKYVSTHLQVTSSGMALIPKDSLEEVLCYEFKGLFNGKNFIVYVNAQDGNEEDILLLIESEEGILTV